MTIKVQCPCGAKYSFEVEPVEGRMPYAVSCPVCNADGTEQANEVIAAQSVGAPKLRVQIEHPVAEAAPAPRPIPQVPQASAMERLRQERRQMRRVGWLIGAVALVVLGLVGGWIWYLVAGSKPRLEYSMKIPPDSGEWHGSFLDANTVLYLSPARAVAHDLAHDKDLWITPLTEGGASPSEFRPPKTFIDRGNIWISLGNRVLRLDRATGAIKQTLDIKGEFVSFTPTASNILVVSAKGETAREAVQIDLATGDTSSRDIVVPRSAKHQMPNELPPNVQPTAAVLLSQALDEQKFNKPLDAMSSEFFSTGANLVELRVKLIEPKVIYVQSIKPRGPTHIDGNLTASTPVGDVEEEVFNDIKRSQTGGVKTIDQSTYEVKLRRWTDATPVEWTGDVSGVPCFFPLKTVDLLVGGQTLDVFDKQNNKLFEAKLSYPISDRFLPGQWDHQSVPAAEDNGSLYFFDKGVLTAFSLPGGDVRWRATSIGITKAQSDGRGSLYVDSTTAAPEDIQYSDQIKFQGASPVLLKIDEPSGKILWQTPRIGEDCYLSGPYLYITSVTVGGIAMANGLAEALNSPKQEGPTYLHIDRIDPADGKVLWDFYREERPEELSFNQNRFLIRFPDRILAYKFLVF
ncbi:MAG TPA: hypothetical protein VGN61_00040 [Verrucomicrobiae bacterium]|jgi:hypothetical protein